jgi:hypothetical protein
MYRILAGIQRRKTLLLLNTIRRQNSNILWDNGDSLAHI